MFFHGLQIASLKVTASPDFGLQGSDFCTWAFFASEVVVEAAVKEMQLKLTAL